MKYLLKFLLLIYMVALFAVKGAVPYQAVLVLLLIIAVNVFKERFFDSVYLTAVSFILISAGIWLDQSFSFLLCLPAFDLIYQKAYPALAPVLLVALYSSLNSGRFSLLLVLGICAILAYVLQKAEEKELLYKNKLDDERRLRYELEQAKAKLLNSSKDIAHLAEANERNRIAREIHDNVGHSIAGILIQLQAALKLFNRDEEKSKLILTKSIDSLSDSLTLLRNTVYNIKPQETLGVEYIKSVIDNFAFCPVDFKFYGDFSSLSPNQLEILASNIKEALTNASKHSQATKLNISIDINARHTRLYVKDNGVGCANLKEGLGISGVKERVQNMGGSVSISSDDGFLIVCLLPNENSQEVG